MLDDNKIQVIFSGPVWADGVDSLAEIMQKCLEFDLFSFNTSQSVFSIFVEQINNILLYSAEKYKKSDEEGKLHELSKGIFILGAEDSTYFMQCGNIVTSKAAEILKSRIDHINSLEKNELRQFYKECLKAENNNSESKGAGLGLIEIARRSSTPIEYELEPHDSKSLYFTMCVTVQQKKME